MTHNAAAVVFSEKCFEFSLKGFSEIFKEKFQTKAIENRFAAAGKGMDEESAAPPIADCTIELKGCRP